MLKKNQLQVPLLAVFIIFGGLMSCDDSESDIIDEEVLESPNHFTMSLNGQPWRPYETDPCNSTYGCWWSSLGDDPFYTIKAFYDENGVSDSRADNQIRIQVVDVHEPGVYAVTGSYQANIDAYALFVDKTGVSGQETGKRYVNDVTLNSFFVKIDEIFPSHFLPGISGSFYGTLYNENDMSDSIVIENGDFRFENMNKLGDHCIE